MSLLFLPFFLLGLAGIVGAAIAWAMGRRRALAGPFFGVGAFLMVFGFAVGAIAGQAETTATPPAAMTGMTMQSEEFAITAPVLDANGFLPFGKFTLAGTGKAGTELEIFDGETNIGKTNVGMDNTWRFEVEPTNSGDRDFSMRGAGMTNFPTLTLNIAEKGGTGPACPCKLRIGLSNPKTSDASVRISSAGQKFEDKTGAEANWSDLPAGDYELTVSKNGFKTYTGTASLPKNRSLKVYLNPGK
jgi:hypothetical protein